MKDIADQNLLLYDIVAFVPLDSNNLSLGVINKFEDNWVIVVALDRETLIHRYTFYRKPEEILKVVLEQTDNPYLNAIIRLQKELRN